VKASGLDWTIVRPPAIYGPGDREMLELFRMARRGIMLLPPGGRLSVIEVSDLARLFLTLAVEKDMKSLTHVYEVDDGTPGGWDHMDFAQVIGRAVGRPVRAFATPAWLLGMGARLDRLVRGRNAKLTPDRVHYFCHPDWVVKKRKQPLRKLWVPKVPTEEGLKATAQAYRAKGWL
jgi:nucleoside-diphosphate-sugar epimerase